MMRVIRLGIIIFEKLQEASKSVCYAWANWTFEICSGDAYLYLAYWL